MTWFTYFPMFCWRGDKEYGTGWGCMEDRVKVKAEEKHSVYLSCL